MCHKNFTFGIFVFQKSASGGDVGTSFMILFDKIIEIIQNLFYPTVRPPAGELFHLFNKNHRKSSNICLKMMLKFLF